MRVLVAMSGGVDSAVAAARAVDAGHEVVGVHLALSRASATYAAATRGCCSAEDAGDARRVADILGIPFYVWDFAERFTADVVEDFVDEYAAGRTPNPCVRCNERIKFAALLDRALALDFDAVCTGHYARLTDVGDGGPPRLHRAVDAAKDQSYVLAGLTPGQLAAVLFPLGDSHKEQVRTEAAARGLRVAGKRDSHDICFIPDGDIRGWLAARLGPRPGEIVDLDGQRLGRHDGSYAYTVGQRRGLRLGASAPDGRPRYVVQVRPRTGTVVVGPRSALEVGTVTGAQARWCGPAPTMGAQVGAQVRAHGEEVPGRLDRVDPDGTVRVRLDRPLVGVAPGQTLALYDGTRVIGSATVTATVAGTAR